MNTDIAALQTIVDVLQDNDCVTDVVPVVEGTTIIGYTLRFLHHDPITIYHGEKGDKGDKGDEGLTPTIGIRQDTDGVWYWTLNGEWLTDSLGNKIKAESRDGKDGENGQDEKDGEDGQDGVTPQLKIEEEYWYVSYTDGASWERLGKATGETGTTGESFFRDVTQDAENVYLTLSDGTTVTVPKGTSLNISFAESDLTRMPVNSTRELHYTVTGAISEATVEALSSADMKVKVEPDDATGINGKIVLVSGAEINDDSKVVIFVTNGERMLMRTLLFDKVGIPAVEETTKCVDAAGGRIELAFLSDSDCEAEIPDEARSWVRVAPSSRALTPHSIVLDIAANTDRPRSTVVTVRSVSVPTQCIEYTVEQAVGSTLLLYTTTGPLLIPRDIFAERSTAVSFAVSFVFASCSSERPVVQSTNGSFFFAQYSNTLSVAFADEKSIIASASTSHASISVNTGYPLSLLSTISIPATISASASFSTRPLITCPM